MSDTSIGPLRQRTIEDMTVRKFGEATQRNYIRAVETLSEFLGRGPNRALRPQLHFAKSRLACVYRRLFMSLPS
jgi:hypothetical protein